MRYQEKPFRAEDSNDWSVHGGATSMKTNRDSVAEGSASIQFNKIDSVNNIAGIQYEFISARDARAYTDLDLLIYTRVSDDDSEKVVSISFRIEDSSGVYNEWTKPYKHISNGRYTYFDLSSTPTDSNGSLEFATTKKVYVYLTLGSVSDTLTQVLIDDIHATDSTEDLIKPYLPDWWEEDDTFVLGINEQIRDLKDRVDLFLNDIYVQQASENAISTWEGFLGIAVKGEYTLVERRARILNRIRGTSTTIRDLLDTAESIIGTRPTYFDNFNNTNPSDTEVFSITLICKSPTVAGYSQELLQTECNSVAPAHCIVILQFENELFDATAEPTENLNSSNLQGGTWGADPDQIDWSGSYIWL